MSGFGSQTKESRDNYKSFGGSSIELGDLTSEAKIGLVEQLFKLL